MAAPLVTVAVAVAKHLVVDVLTNPEKIVKYILIILGVLLVIILVIALPIFILVSFPSFLLHSGNVTDPVPQEVLQVVSYYQDAPITKNNEAKQWYDQKVQEYSPSCDSMDTTFDFQLNWQMLMAIDSIRKGQDFTNISVIEIRSTADRFIEKKAYKESYQVQESYSYKDSSGKSQTGTKWVTKIRGVVKVTTKSLDTVMTELGFNDYNKGVCQNIYTNLLNMDAESYGNIYDDVDLSNLKEYPPGNSNIPYFNQADKRWGNHSYGTSTIKSGGCGPTSLAMVVTGLTGRTDVTPDAVSDWSVANGCRAEGAGSYWSLMTDGGKYYGLQVEAVSRRDPNKILDALSKGYPVIVAMGPGHFTSQGHFIVLRGVTSGNKIIVNDPASVSRTEQEWDLSIIMDESSTIGGGSGCPFWIFKR